ncbi:hypothetical protein R3P38DRAFT_873133 [Favolaschia claudopus]|uniref:Uncharacterized protein n=1 Tax=Favolaschia claudopus TaxID=2862362 RepID=A0AAV9Z0V5_9AGAR
MPALHSSSDPLLTLSRIASVSCACINSNCLSIWIRGISFTTTTALHNDDPINAIYHERPSVLISASLGILHTSFCAVIMRCGVSPRLPSCPVLLGHLASSARGGIVLALVAGCSNLSCFRSPPLIARWGQRVSSTAIRRNIAVSSPFAKDRAGVTSHYQSPGSSRCSSFHFSGGERARGGRGRGARLASRQRALQVIAGGTRKRSHSSVNSTPLSDPSPPRTPVLPAYNAAPMLAAPSAGCPLPAPRARNREGSFGSRVTQRGKL